MAFGITDLIDSLKSRVRNPFYGSIGVSWLLINWKIPIGLFLLSDKELMAMGCANKIEFIERNMSFDYSLFYPILLGAALAAISPLLTSVFRIIRSKAEAVYMDDQRRKAEKLHIPMTKYLELKALYDEKLMAVNDVIKAQEVFKEERHWLNDRIDKLTGELVFEKEERDKNVAQLRAYRNPRFPDWFRNLFDLFDGSEKVKVFVYDNKIFTVNDYDAKDHMWYSFENLSYVGDNFLVMFCVIYDEFGDLLGVSNILFNEDRKSAEIRRPNGTVMWMLIKRGKN